MSDLISDKYIRLRKHVNLEICNDIMNIIDMLERTSDSNDNIRDIGNKISEIREYSDAEDFSEKLGEQLGRLLREVDKSFKN